jgi:serine/threonine-protein kinase
MSPEQALGEGGVDPRTDVWALGVVLYEMLTGRLPFEAESYAALLPKIIERPHPPLPATVPAEVRTVVAGCLAKDRGDRYPSADAVLEAIERALAALHTTEPGSVRSGFFVETGRGMAPSAPSFASAVPGAPGSAGARIGLALAILALPVAIGIAAVATRVSRGSAGSDPRPSQAAPPPPPPPAAPSATEPLPAAPPPVRVPGPSASVSAAPSPASSAPLRRSIRGPKSKVTGVDSAGF